MAIETSFVPVQTLGPCTYPSPLALSHTPGDGIGNFIPDGTPVPFNTDVYADFSISVPRSFQRAGPRGSIYFDPAGVHAAIVTCGGLCPGLNNVIRSIVLELWHAYGVRQISGLRYGYRGLNPAYDGEPLHLTPDLVDPIHEFGGTILGSSRGPQPFDVMANFIERNAIDMLFCVGGDGTMRGAHALHKELHRRGRATAVVGVPKTIDNDIRFVRNSFGFVTAVQRARDAVRTAHVEAHGAPRGVGVVKLMGRDSGFIAAMASVTEPVADFTLVPEVPFGLEGENGLLACVGRKLAASRHAVVVVAEGAGQDLFTPADPFRDASGNVKHHDIGTFLCERIAAHFQAAGDPVSIKYIDPSYLIRSAPANTTDSQLADAFARRAVHAAMAGKTNVVIGTDHGIFFHVPIELAVEKKQYLSPEADLWSSVLSATGQPRRMM
ncbi:MAG: ATP-dependent 6-phosphofructokinase [Phycisphaerae bacterium]